MFLILQVTSPNAADLGPAARASFTVKGGTIGRRAGNDWVLADPHVSGRHARVRSVGGTFFLEDAESANGVLVNGTKLHQGEPFPLKDGDSIYIDPYEISVKIVAAMPGATTEILAQSMAAAAPPAGAPVAPLPPADLLRPGASPGYGVDPLAAGPLSGDAGAQPGGLADIIGPEASGIPSTFNPLLDTPPEQSTPGSGLTGRDLYGKPVINDALRVPAPVVPPPQAGGIPLDWDAPEAPPAPALAPGRSMPEARPVSMPEPPPAPPVPPVPPPPTTRGAPSDLDALLRGAGIEDARLSPDVAGQLGAVLRFVVEGLMEVLRARGEIKNEFRLPQTTFKPRENNPLKFSANVEDALHNLLVKRNPAYLDTPSAFEDAFADVRHHQLAMLAGMRAAFDDMLRRFSPEALRSQFDVKPGRKSSFGFGSSGRYWDSYEEFYKELTSDVDDCFRRLFGDQFARSYEEQLKRLAALKRRDPPQS
jgi:type VI secretion system protein ImpI